MKKDLWYLILILTLALVLRLIFVFGFEPCPIVNDAAIYDTTAWNLIQGKGYVMQPGLPFAGREPGYPLFLALIYFLFGHNYTAVYVIQALIGASICFFIYLICSEAIAPCLDPIGRLGTRILEGRDKLSESIEKERLKHKTGLIAALFVALYPPFIAYSSLLLTEIWFAFLLLITVWLLAKALKTNSIKFYFLGGLFLGLTTLTRGTTLLFPIFLFIALMIAYKQIKKAALHSGVVFLGMLLLVSPWIIRNYSLFYALVPVRTGSGESLWAGSYIPWDGEWRGYIEPLTTLSRGLDPVKADRLLTKEMINNIKQAPLGIAWLWLKKPAKMWLIPVGDVRYVDLMKRYSFPHLVIRGSLYFIHEIALLLALIGIGLTFRRKEFLLMLLILFYFTVIHLPVTVVPRYALPAMSFMLIYSAVTCDRGINRWFSKGL